MTRALCAKCFSDKHGCWTFCEQCGFTPHGEGQLALSLVLSDHFLGPEDFGHIQQRFQDFGELPDIGDDLLEYALKHVTEAREALTKQGLLDKTEGL